MDKCIAFWLNCRYRSPHMRYGGSLCASSFPNHQVPTTHIFTYLNSNLIFSICIARLQVHIFSGAGRFTSDFDLRAAGIRSIHIWIVAMGICFVSYHRMRQRHIDRRVRVHIDRIISRTLLCHRQSAQKTTGKYYFRSRNVKYTTDSASRHSGTHGWIDFLKWILNYLYPHAMLLLLSAIPAIAAAGCVTRWMTALHRWVICAVTFQQTKWNWRGRSHSTHGTWN